jgi:hypothetical protein
MAILAVCVHKYSFVGTSMVWLCTQMTAQIVDLEQGSQTMCTSLSLVKKIGCGGVAKSIFGRIWDTNFADWDTNLGYQFCRLGYQFGIPIFPIGLPIWDTNFSDWDTNLADWVPNLLLK